jgi:large subunit ribosomal protein L15
MKLSELSPAPGSTKARKRIGRGVASGQGTTAGRGYNGQNSRSGGGTRPGYEGGQMPIHRRLPKRGFKNIFKKKFVILNLKDLAAFEAGTVVDELALVKAGLVKGRYDGIKILGDGDINVALTIKSCKTSETAMMKITKAGGTIEA